MSEIELKFGVDPECVAIIDAALRRLPSRRISIESRYFDSDGFDLARAGLSLRLRRTGQVWEQTLKAPTGSFAERLEETIPRPGRWGRVGPALDAALHDGTAAGKLLSAARNTAEAPAALRLVFTSVIVRRSVEIAALGARVEAAFDRGEIRAVAASTPVCELEYELKQGDVGALVEFGRAGVREHGLWLSTLSKAARGDLLVRGDVHAPAGKARAPRLDRTLSGPAIFHAVLEACLDQVLANASTVAEGHRDAEAIHQLRVGLRRMRTCWGELGALSGHAGLQWPAALTAAFRSLGDYRDRTTVGASLQARLSAAGSPEPTLRAPNATADPVDVVRGKDFQCALLDALALTLAAPAHGGDGSARVEGGAGESGVLAEIGSHLDKLHASLKRAAKRFERSSPELQHRTRKRLKRLRYLAELVATLYKPARVERYLDALRPAQDALGAHIDLVVGLRMAHDAALGGDAAAWFNVGWLTAQLDASASGCGKALLHAARAKPFWKRQVRIP